MCMEPTSTPPLSSYPIYPIRARYALALVLIFIIAEYLL